MRGIQYAATARMNMNVSGVLGHPPSRVTTAFMRRAPEMTSGKSGAYKQSRLPVGQITFDAAYVTARDA
jgi:hypothetical protein